MLMKIQEAQTVKKNFMQNHRMAVVLRDIIVIRLINPHSTEPKTNEITISKMLPIELRGKKT